ncbi:hypothetical protein VNI00_006401 [Paramarasmius palmivorus]|uniref:Cytochrome P450 n=1 Tax=Paramarasmius palmivorus TaxID=297713 RepID=A0AAW0DA66_9AGAR
MALLTADLVAGIFCFVLLARLLRRSSRLIHELPLPPGPPKLPFLGNLLQLPRHREWEIYLQWDKQYGALLSPFLDEVSYNSQGNNSGIIQFSAAGTSIVVINNAQIAIDLLEKRSRIYSSRPPAPMTCDLMGWDWNLGFQPYDATVLIYILAVHIGERWRQHRRLFLKAFNREAAKKFRPIELDATHHLLARLLEDPAAFLSHLKHHAAQVVMSVAYGLEIQTHDDPYVALAEDAIVPLFEALVPGTFLVDSIPSLRHVPSWLPGAGFQQKAREGKNLALRMLNEPFDASKKLIASGHNHPSFVASLLQTVNENEDFEAQETLIRETAGGMYLAGSDTTVAALATFIFAMAISPEVQRKAREEIDRVVQAMKLPTFEDEESLPYATALVWEVLRWQNVTPIGVPHCIEDEDEYMGYRIPAGSVVISNVWAILHDEVRGRLFLLTEVNAKIEPLSRAFRIQAGKVLEEWEDQPFSQGSIVCGAFVPDEKFSRVCPGRHMAYPAVWIAIVSMLKTLDISKAIDEDGNIIELVFVPNDAINGGPRPFECSIKPRSKEAERYIREQASALTPRANPHQLSA